MTSGRQRAISKHWLACCYPTLPYLFRFNGSTMRYRVIKRLAAIAAFGAVSHAIGQSAFGAAPSRGALPVRDEAAPSILPTPPTGATVEAGNSAEDLGALTLRAALDLGFSNNRDLQSARATLDAARGVLVSAGKRPNPTLTVGGGPGLLGQYRLRDADVLINYSQLIERGNKRELRTDAAV